MCIRDRAKDVRFKLAIEKSGSRIVFDWTGSDPQVPGNVNFCLLYTSDAADERSSVDLGGRRIIKKKKSAHQSRSDTCIQK